MCLSALQAAMTALTITIDPSWWWLLWIPLASFLWGMGEAIARLIINEYLRRKRFGARKVRER